MLRQFEAELENFSQSSLALQRVAADVASSGRAIEHLKEQNAGVIAPNQADTLAVANFTNLMHRSQKPSEEIGASWDAACTLRVSYATQTSSLQSLRCVRRACRPGQHGHARPDAGQEMLVPLTQSLYVPGELADTEHVLVDIGTGYFVEVRDAASRVWAE